MMFLRLQTQWVVGGMGTPIGLNYQSVEFLFKIYKVRNTRRYLDDIREIEAGALGALREKDDKPGGKGRGV